MAEGSGADRREFERISARIEIHFRSQQDAARSLKAFSLNFSAGGVCIRTKRAYSVGERLAIFMKVDGEDYDLKGIVSWVRQEAIGVRFAEVSEGDRLRLNSLVKQLRTTNAPA